MKLTKEEKKGWEYHTKKYLNSHTTVSKKTKKKYKSKDSKLILINLDKKRKKIANELFHGAYCKNMTGSKNITSDYDLTLFLSTDNIEIYRIFLDTLRKLNINLAEIFDMNIYFYELLCNKINKIYSDTFYTLKIPRLECKYNHLFLKVNKEIYDIQVKVLLVKYVENSFNNKDINYDMNSVKLLNNNLQGEIKGKQYFNRYKLQCMYSEKCNILLREINEDIEYDHNKVLEFVYFQLLARYYAIEGYYTISSLNVVVYELTLGAKLKLNKYDYILTIIENWMDFFEHIGNKLSDMSLLNYSKYLFRIYYSWNKLKKIGLKMPKFINLEPNLRISTFLKNNRGNIDDINNYNDEINKLYNNKDIKEIKKKMYQQVNYLIDNY